MGTSSPKSSTAPRNTALVTNSLTRDLEDPNCGNASVSMGGVKGKNSRMTYPQGAQEEERVPTPYLGAQVIFSSAPAAHPKTLRHHTPPSNS